MTVGKLHLARMLRPVSHHDRTDIYNKDLESYHCNRSLRADLISVVMRNTELYLAAEPAVPGEELGNPVPDHSVARVHELKVAVCPRSLSVSTPM